MGGRPSGHPRQNPPAPAGGFCASRTWGGTNWGKPTPTHYWGCFRNRFALDKRLAQAHGVPMSDDLIPTREAARLLGRSIWAVHRLVDKGALTVAYRLPGRNGLLFHRTDVVALSATENEEVAS